MLRRLAHESPDPCASAGTRFATAAAMGRVSRLDTPLRSQMNGATREVARWVVPLARFGYAAKGVVYGLVGVLAFVSAIESRQQDATTKGALRTILGESPLLLGLVAFGLAAYALWRFVQGIKDTERRGTSIAGLALRLGAIGIGMVYVGLALSALRLIQGQGAGADSDAKAVGWTAWLMQQPFGPWLVAAVGIGLTVFGVREAWRGYKAEFAKKLLLGRMSPRARVLARRSGRAGEMARGVVWVVIGALLVTAALKSDPSQARGLGGALRELGAQPYGMWLLGAVALGLIAYGVFMLVLARYRRIVVD